MEEQKKAKAVNMNIASKKEESNKKLTYEQLNDACNQLWQQNKQLSVRNRELESFVMNKRLDYLFKVVEFSTKFSSDFIVNCISEIEEAMTIPQNNTEEPKNMK